jgi:hypothetical protein
MKSGSRFQKCAVLEQRDVVYLFDWPPPWSGPGNDTLDTVLNGESVTNIP